MLPPAIKAHKNYTTAIGDILGIEGPELSPPDFNTIQPVIKALATGGIVKITWGWGGHREFLSMCEIQVNRGPGWVPLTYDTTPNYDDTQPHPPPPPQMSNPPNYPVDDHQVGLWSAEVSVTVGA